MIRSRSSSRWARSSSSTEVKTFLFRVLSKRRCLRTEMSDAASKLPSSLSLLLLLLSWSFRSFWECRQQSVWQEILITKAARVRTSPIHTPETKYRAAPSGFSVGEGGRREHLKDDNYILRERTTSAQDGPLSPGPKALMTTNNAFSCDKLHNVFKYNFITNSVDKDCMEFFHYSCNFNFEIISKRKVKKRKKYCFASTKSK